MYRILCIRRSDFTVKTIIKTFWLFTTQWVQQHVQAIQGYRNTKNIRKSYNKINDKLPKASYIPMLSKDEKNNLQFGAEETLG